MRNPLERRNRHELAEAEFFVARLAENDRRLTNCRKGDEAAGEPDVVCELGGERGGIEVVDCWYSSEEAQTVGGLVADLEGQVFRLTVASTAASTTSDATPPAISSSPSARTGWTSTAFAGMASQPG